MRSRLLAACFGGAAAVCFVVAYVNRNSDDEGAYFTTPTPQGPGWTAYAIEDPPRLENSLFNPFDPWYGHLWLGAGIALVLAARAVLVFGRFASRFASPS